MRDWGAGGRVDLHERERGEERRDVETGGIKIIDRGPGRLLVSGGAEEVVRHL